MIITTRNREVPEKIGSSIYNKKPLSDEISGILFYGQIFGSREMCPKEFSVVSAKILKKCGGVPLAICTISSLLANKKENIADWDELCGAIGSGLAKDPSMEVGQLILRWMAEDLSNKSKQQTTCCNLRDHNLSYVGSLVQLRYLGLWDTKYAGELPKDLGKLQFLQTLDLMDTWVKELPASIMRLKRLMILRLGHYTRLPSDSFRNLTALEELSGGKFIESPNFVEELGGLTNLRELKIYLPTMDQSSRETLVPSLCCMQS
ncbi:hypothetical protein EJB05_50883, partial [Eragrostis curvula]